ncbi:prolipoprotein diacylglyceryl transferase [Candidatus Woesearchaeota archaeon]|nr:prolipoprotein diacylglyceryl transferase [Candidatus Woesearchaeota archaeon]
MFVHQLDPVLFQIGSLEIRYYGIVYVLGFLMAYWFLSRAASSGRIRNLTKDGVDDLILYLFVGLLVGSRLFYFLFWSETSLLSDPVALFRIWEGGMSFHGGIVGIVLAALLFCKRSKVSFYALGDLVVIPTAFALFLGRIANFINGELVGVVSNIWWCVQFQGYDGCRHPSQLYEAGKNLFVFFVLLWMDRRKVVMKFKEGFLFWSFIGLYGVFRFLTNIWRDDPRWLGISLGQGFSLVMVVVAVVVVVRVYRDDLKRLFSF